MYAVVHGGVDKELRAMSAEYLSSLPFDGFAVGGSLGANRQEMLDLLGYVLPLLPEDKPNHILGIADPESVAGGVVCGGDTFDSCWPTHVARHGTLLTRDGVMHIGQGKYKNQFVPVDPTMPWDFEDPTWNCMTRAYLHHLLRKKEPLFYSLASMHNVRFMQTLMAEMREKIMADEI